MAGGGKRAGGGVKSDLEVFIASALGCDRYGMQLDGVGAGISSTSKVVIVEQSSRPGHDVDYTFGQVDMQSGEVDWSGSCGNLASAVGLFAIEEGLVKKPSRSSSTLPHTDARDIDTTSTTVNVFQTNLKYTMQVTVASAAEPADMGIPGIEAFGRPISVNFLNPTVANLPLLPSGERPP
jgi:2-methylaconitate cis-trans-isomerase PrpF